MRILVVAVIFAIFYQARAQNYCDSRLCSRNRPHIACRNNGRWATGCEGVMINMRPHVNQILQLHNERRDRVAGARLARFPSAVRMATMTWNAELARIAVYNALRCRMEHDECRNTPAYRYAGQNLSILYTRNVTLSNFLAAHIENWFGEHRYATRSDVKRYRNRDGPAIGHFTAMVNERNNRVGCAISQFSYPRRQKATYLVCNYAVTNMINNPVYRFGSSGSQCRTGRHPRYRNLCSVSESYNHNQWSG